MKDFMLMEPSNCSLQDLLGQGSSYQVPRFQRDYAWQLEQWEDLWTDIESLPQEHFHYIGYIVLQRKNHNQFDVIDGQQRLVTLSLLVLAALRVLQDFIDNGADAADNQERLEELRRSFIGNKDVASLRVNNKLALNRNNDRFYKAISNELQAPARRRLTTTNKLLMQCFEFFRKKMSLPNGVEVATKLAQIGNGIIFTKVVVQDDLNAYKVFETLNARGVQLSTPDLIKNYIFSIITKNDDVSDEELDELDMRWAEIIEQLGETNFTEFVRYHHNARAPLSTKNNLFRAIRNLVQTPAQAHDYINSLVSHAAVYGALLESHDEFWHTGLEATQLEQLRHYLEGFKLFNIRQPFGILMTAYFKMSRADFVKLVKVMFVLAVRYNIVGKHSPNAQELAFNKISMAIDAGTISRPSGVKTHPEFRKLYPADDNFKNEFSLLSMPTRQSSKKVRYLLASLETFLGNHCDHGNCVLEHVCPYNAEQHWQDSFGDGIESVQDRLGNVVLLERDVLARASFADKREAYLASGFELAKKVASFEEWNQATVNQYQQWLAEQAVRMWQVE